MIIRSPSDDRWFCPAGCTKTSSRDKTTAFQGLVASGPRFDCASLVALGASGAIVSCCLCLDGTAVATLQAFELAAPAESKLVQLELHQQCDNPQAVDCALHEAG